MRSKAEVIATEFAGLHVLDIGGMGFGEDNAYERDLKAAWSHAAGRTIVDCSESADIRMDLNALPLRPLAHNRWDVAALFDTLEHLDHPVEVLRWIPSNRALVTLPNARSPIARYLEERGRFPHLFSFTAYTAGVLLQRAGWQVIHHEYLCGKWSPLTRFINAAGSLAPALVGTGILLTCARANPAMHADSPAAIRQTDVPVDPIFPDRWSPRAFQPDPIPDDQIRSLIEAARWAPSCFNEQPWLFCFANEPDARERILATLFERNRMWAKQAPLLMLLASRRVFVNTGKTNRHAGFDAGAAWLSLALQARRLGLYAHAMAGFDPEKALAITGLNGAEWDIRAAIAVGRRGDPAHLPEDLRAIESPNTRKPLADIMRRI